jgi:hypothetical protein
VSRPARLAGSGRPKLETPKAVGRGHELDPVEDQRRASAGHRMMLGIENGSPDGDPAGIREGDPSAGGNEQGQRGRRHHPGHRARHDPS